MSGHKLYRAHLVALVSIGLLLSPSVALAGNVPQAQVTDISLASGGALIGQIVDQQGIGKAGVQVVVRQGQETLVTTTDQKGFFEVKGLRGGTCQIAAGEAQAAYRLWAVNTAPPAAHSDVMLVSDGSIVRANVGFFASGWGQWILPALAAGGVIAGVAIATSTGPASN